MGKFWFLLSTINVLIAAIANVGFFAKRRNLLAEKIKKVSTRPPILMPYCYFCPTVDDATRPALPRPLDPLETKHCWVRPLSLYIFTAVGRL